MKASAEVAAAARRLMGTDSERQAYLNEVRLASDVSRAMRGMSELWASELRRLERGC